MNAIEKIQDALGVKKSVSEVAVVVSVGNGFVVAHKLSGGVLRLNGSWQIGTKLIVRSGVVESVVVESGVVIYED